MRRKDKEITDRVWMDEVINRAPYMTVALCSLDAKPYAVPMTQVYDGENLYFHCAKEGLKLDLIADNPRAAFNAVAKADYYQNEKTHLYTMHYESVSGWGTIALVEDSAEKMRALELIKDKFIQGEYHVTEEIATHVAILKLHIEEIYGKKSDKL